MTMGSVLCTIGILSSRLFSDKLNLSLRIEVESQKIIFTAGTLIIVRYKMFQNNI